MFRNFVNFPNDLPQAGRLKLFFNSMGTDYKGPLGPNPWILPSYVKEVEYARVRDINFTSANKMKADLDATLDRVFDISQGDKLAEEPKIESKSVPAPSEEEMNSLYVELNNCKFKPIALSLVPPFAESFVLKSPEIPTIQDLSDPKHQDLEYPELLQVCLEKEIELSEEQRLQIEEDTRSQSQGLEPPKAK